jgi:hypothetical protein
MKEERSRINKNEIRKPEQLKNSLEIQELMVVEEDA